VEVRKIIDSELKKISSRIEITYATSRDEAVSILNRGVFFDYITLDLTIPVVLGSFEKDSKNGLAVLGSAKSLCPGTPILILTGTSTIDMISRFLDTSNNVDIWSEGISRPTVSHLTKSELAHLAQKVKPHILAVLRLSDVELSYSFENLPIAHDRLIRILAKKVEALTVYIDVIGGGHSNATVYSLVLNDAFGVELHRCVAKCGSRLDIDADCLNFDTHVVRLEPEATPRKIAHLRYGAGDSCAVFYGFAANYTYSFFSASKNDSVTENIQQSLINILSNWHSKSVQQRKQIKDIRRSLLNDEHFDRLVATHKITDAEEFESHYLQCNVSYIHGDLHGENVLVSAEKDCSTLIDYGDVQSGCSILDPLTLECSFLFHDKSPFSDWPSLKALEKWSSVEDYLIDCPYSAEVRFCRKWIKALGVSNRELAACLYSYAIRQLKYSDTDKDKALLLIRISFELYDRS
jgi:CheY-like chemotaxis protein